MSKHIHSKFRFDRLIGENMWGLRRSSVNRVQSASGQHGDGSGGVRSRSRRRRKSSSREGGREDRGEGDRG